MKDIKEVGYGNMRVYNYRKNGDVFEVNVTVYPVFDTICSVGPDAEIAVLTHFASVMTDIKPVSASRRHDHQSIGEAKSNHDHAMKVTMPTFSDGDTSHSSSTSMLNESGRGDEEDTSSSKKSVDKYDRRQQAKKHAPKFVLSPEVSLPFF